MKAPPSVRLVSVRGNPDASGFLFDLLLERPKYAWISHAVMPSRVEHERFVANHPFRYWYLIDADGTYVGALECTDMNEIGVHILFAHQRKGYGAAALRKFVDTHHPLPAIKAVRNPRWLANIGTANIAAREFFKEAGFQPLQVTYAL